MLTFSVVVPPSHGTLTDFDSAAGTITYVPTPNYHGPDSFTFTTSYTPAGHTPVTSSAATVSILVGAAPSAVGLTDTTAEEVPLTLTLSGHGGVAAQTASLSYAVVSPPSHGSLSGLNGRTGSITYTPNPGYHGSDSFSYVVLDDLAAPV